MGNNNRRYSRAASTFVYFIDNEHVEVSTNEWRIIELGKGHELLGSFPIEMGEAIGGDQVYLKEEFFRKARPFTRASREKLEAEDYDSLRDDLKMIHDAKLDDCKYHENTIEMISKVTAENLVALKDGEHDIVNLGDKTRALQEIITNA